MLIWIRITLLTVLTAIVGNSFPIFASPESPYKLPYPTGKEYKVTQGNFGSGSHNDPLDSKPHYAFDFNLADGDVVVASRGGKTLSIQNEFGKGKCDRSHANLVNYILIDHGDGTTSLYLHLQKGSVVVKEGEEVKQGQVIGKADSSGYVCGAHLHFQVQKTPSRIWIDDQGQKKGWYTQSVQISFADQDVQNKHLDGIPTGGKNNPYVSDNVQVATEQLPTLLQVAGWDCRWLTAGCEANVTNVLPQSLSVRERPGTTQRISSSLFEGNSVCILGAPVMEGGYKWLPIRLEDNQEGWAATFDPKERPTVLWITPTGKICSSVVSMLVERRGEAIAGAIRKSKELGHYREGTGPFPAHLLYEVPGQFYIQYFTGTGNIGFHLLVPDTELSTGMMHLAMLELLEGYEDVACTFEAVFYYDTRVARDGGKNVTVPVCPGQS